MRYNFISVEGCIGAGKTTLAKKLAHHYNSELLLETFEDNPFLPNFYQDKKRFAFQVELFFMAERFKQHEELTQKINLFTPLVIADYFFSKSKIFANLTLENENEKHLFNKLYSIMQQSITQPQLLVFLHTKTEKLLSNIKKRNRSYEQSIEGEYLENIQNNYMNYFKSLKNTPILIIDNNNLDYLNNPADFEWITNLFKTKWNPGITYI